jgi:hypothetical protein
VTSLQPNGESALTMSVIASPAVFLSSSLVVLCAATIAMRLLYAQSLA